MSSPTALNKRGSKVIADGLKFDSAKEYAFYDRFIKNCGFKYEVHPSFNLEELQVISNGIKIRAIRYTPDVVVYDQYGNILHVYDVKNSFGPYGIDTGNKLRFNLFARQYGIPVEAVVIRKNDFKTIAQCVSKPLPVKSPLVTKTVDYPWINSTAL